MQRIAPGLWGEYQPARLHEALGRQPLEGRMIGEYGATRGFRPIQIPPDHADPHRRYGGACRVAGEDAEVIGLRIEAVGKAFIRPRID